MHQFFNSIPKNTLFEEFVLINNSDNKSSHWLLLDDVWVTLTMATRKKNVNNSDIMYTSMYLFVTIQNIKNLNCLGGEVKLLLVSNFFNIAKQKNWIL